MKPSDLPDRIASKIEVVDGHWLWMAYISPKGYAQVYWEGKPEGAHRVVYRLLVGPIPKRLQLDHECRIRHCVNPECVEPVTQQENIRRGMGGKLNNHLAARTHCPQGHPYSGENLVMNSQGRRTCRACNHARSVARAAKAKQQRRQRKVDALSH